MSSLIAMKAESRELHRSITEGFMKLCILEARYHTAQAQESEWNCTDIAKFCVGEFVQSLIDYLTELDMWYDFHHHNPPKITYKVIDGNIGGTRYFNHLVPVRLVRLRIGRYTIWIDPSNRGTDLSPESKSYMISFKRPKWFIPRKLVDLGTIIYHRE